MSAKADNRFAEDPDFNPGPSNPGFLHLIHVQAQIMETSTEDEQDCAWSPAAHFDVASRAIPGKKLPPKQAALLFGKIGLGCWLCIFAISALPAHWPPDMVMNLLLVAGPTLALIGTYLGVLSKATRYGRLELVLSLLVLGGMALVIISIHSATGHWTWFRPVKADVSCGCG